MNGKQTYNSEVIHRLLSAAFTVEELRRFCRDRQIFQPVVDDFGPNYNMNQMIDRVIDYCDTKNLWNELLTEVRQLNPRQYQRFESEIFVHDPLPVKDKSRRLDPRRTEGSESGFGGWGRVLLIASLVAVVGSAAWFVAKPGFLPLLVLLLALISSVISWKSSTAKVYIAYLVMLVAVFLAARVIELPSANRMSTPTPPLTIVYLGGEVSGLQEPGSRSELVLVNTKFMGGTLGSQDAAYCAYRIRLANLGFLPTAIGGYTATISYRGTEHTRESSGEAVITFLSPSEDRILSSARVSLSEERLSDIVNPTKEETLPMPYPISPGGSVDVWVTAYLRFGVAVKSVGHLPAGDYPTDWYESLPSIFQGYDPIDVSYTFYASSGKEVVIPDLHCAYFQ